MQSPIFTLRADFCKIAQRSTYFTVLLLIVEAAYVNTIIQGCTHGHPDVYMHVYQFHLPIKSHGHEVKTMHQKYHNNIIM